MGRRCWSRVLEQEELCPEVPVCEGCVAAGCVLGERAGVVARVALGEASSRGNCCRRHRGSEGGHIILLGCVVQSSFLQCSFTARAG